MEPPYPNQPFSFPPQNPNPNPTSFPIPIQNLNLFYSSLPQRPTTTTSTSAAAAASLSDLPTTLSSLNNLIHLSNHALHSLSDLLHRHSNGSDAHLIPCPYNPHHRMPPPSLFRHSLRCPSSPYASLDLDPLLRCLHYPKTLTSSSQFQDQTCPPHDSSADLCVSLDKYLDLGVGVDFFYKDCPGAVGSSLDTSKRILMLPGILSAECSDFVGNGDVEIKGLTRETIGIFPSDLWTVRNEIQAWNNYPSMYSYNVLRTLLGLQVVKGCDLGRMVIANSPKYGIVIDVYVRDHIVVLFRLCLKAIVREASVLLDGAVSRNAADPDFKVDLRSPGYNCPVMVKVLMWMASQFSVLYGESNGKFFAIGMLKDCILEATSRLLMFSSEDNVTQPPTSEKVPSNLDASSSHNRDVKEPIGSSFEVDGVGDKTVAGEVIFVSQVAAAVAALHERSLLEEKIKGLCVFQSLPKYQRMVEHANVTQKADDVRKRCSNYKPIIDHDGLPQHQPSNEETSRTKTREEKLAEERDYKRRRMSYRGKKLKRSTLEVMRDIIEKYMDEIKQAGGIGCFVKGGAEERQFQSDVSAHDISIRNDKYISSEATGGTSTHQRNQSDSEYTISGAKYEDLSFKDFKQPKQGHHRQHELQDRRSYSRNKKDREYYSRSPERSYSRSHGESTLRELDDVNVITRTSRHEAKQVSNDYNRRSSSSISKYANSSNATKNNQKSEDRSRDRRNSYRNNGSDSLLHNAFEDRYDPSESHDMYEDETSTGSRYDRSDKLNAGEFHEQPCNNSAKGQNHGHRMNS